MSTQRSAIIVGAGISGLATAVALLAEGWKVDILERASAERSSGSGFSLTANGLQALDSLGLGDAVRERSAAQHLAGVFTAQGTQLLSAGESDGSYLHGIHRDTLREILLEAAKDADIRYDVEVKSVRTGAKPSVSVVSGSAKETLKADLVVGADGLSSVSRRAIAKVRPDYSGAACFRGVAESGSGIPEFGAIWLDNGLEFGAIPINDEQVYWYAAFKSRLGKVDSITKTALLARLRPFVPATRALVRATPAASLLRHDLSYLPTGLTTYSAEGLVLVGDAAHAMVPTLGQGANQSFEDAATLRVLLSEQSLKAQSLQEALERFTALRLPRTQSLQRLSLHALRYGALKSNPISVSARNAMLNLIPSWILEFAADLRFDWKAPTAQARRD